MAPEGNEFEVSGSGSLADKGGVAAGEGGQAAGRDIHNYPPDGDSRTPTIAIVAIVIVALVVIFVVAIVFRPGKPEVPIPLSTSTETPISTAAYAPMQIEMLTAGEPIPSSTSTEMSISTATYTPTRTEIPTTVEHIFTPSSCPHKVLVLIIPFEEEGGGDLNVERGIAEAFEGMGIIHIDVQRVEEETPLPDTPDVDCVFVIGGWYDSAAVHPKIYRIDDGNQRCPVDYCPPGEANVVSSEVVIAVCSRVAHM